jgi:redox-sensitive bicupin YhaK (pirin superfamily)
MITLRKANERGHANHGWLDSHHTFSFADYYDPSHMGFRALRVINDDRVDGGGGFATHPHRDMEILTYVLDGALEHKDSMGNQGLIRPGEVQRMSAGTGVRHSEANASPAQPVHLLQIWIEPEARNLPPSYEQKMFASDEKQGRLKLVASRDAREGSVTLHQDVSLYAGLFKKGEKAELPLAPNRHAWVHVARGKVKVNGTELEDGDAIAISAEAKVEVEGVDAGEVLVFDLA